MAPASKSTLLNLVQIVSDYATSDDEVVATVAYLVNSGKVLLCGNFAGAKIDLADTTMSTFACELLQSTTPNRCLLMPSCWKTNSFLRADS